MGIVFDIQRCSYHDGPGIRTTVFLKGCPLRCAWCHNPESFSYKPQLKYAKHMCVSCGKCMVVCPNDVHSFSDHHEVDFSKCVACGMCTQTCPTDALTILGREMSAKEVIDVVIRDKAYYNNDGGMTVSGGEPTSQPEFLYDLIKIAKDENINVCIETNGYIPKATLAKIIPYVDTFLVDFKLTSDEKLKELTCADGNLWDNTLETLAKENKDVILRMPIIPNINDTKTHMEHAASIAVKYKNIKNVEIMPYHSIGADKWNQLGLEYSLKNLSTATPTQKDLWNAMLNDALSKAGWNT